MSDKKGITIYLSAETIATFKEASKEQGRSMASQGELLIKKFNLNSKRRAGGDAKNQLDMLK